MRRFVLAAVVCVAFAGMMPAIPASAAGELELTGEFVSSPNVNAEHVIVRFCPAAGDGECQQRNIDTTGSFSVTLIPDLWDVTVYASSVAPLPYWWAATAEVEILDSDDWTLQLPTLSRVALRTRDAGGEPLAGLTVTGSSATSPVTFSPDLPAFNGSTSAQGPRTDVDGRSVFALLPDSDFDLKVTGREGSLEYRLPLATPTRTSIDASADVAVRARALPLHTVSFRVQDHAGRPVPANYFGVVGSWGTVNANFPSAGPAVFAYPESDADLVVASGDSVWYLPSSWKIEQPISVTDSDAFTLTLPEPVRTRVTVEDADTGVVAEGVRVQVGGTADPATLAPDLAPAMVVNGGFRGLRAISNADGGVQFRTFPDSTLTTSATVQGPGLYRTSPEKDVDASSDGQFTVRLPKSVVIDIDARDAAGDPMEASTAQLRVGPEYVVPFAKGPDGRPQMRVSPGPAAVEANLVDVNGDTRYGVSVKRDVVVTEDTTLEYQLPEQSVDVTVVAIDHHGAVIPDTRISVSGRTTVQTDVGPMRVAFSVGGSTTNGQGVGHVMSPPANLADVYAYYDAYAEDVELVADRTVVVQTWNPQLGAGVPYALFEAPAPITLDATGTLTYRRLDGVPYAGTRWTRSIFGERSAEPITSWVNNDVAMQYPAGATSCAQVASRRGDELGPTSPFVCRTRPVDDKAFDRVGAWRRVVSASAQGGGFVTATQRRSVLELRGVDIPSGTRPGVVSLTAFTGLDAGSVRLRVRDQWASEPVSLRGPASAEPTVVPVPLYDWWQRAAVRGRLEVVVVSDGLRVRVDGLAWPVPTAPEPFLAHL